MCGRYAATAHPDELVLTFEVENDATDQPTATILKSPQVPPPGAPDTNLAPTKLAPVVLSRAPRGEKDAPPQRQLRLFTWGLIPGWEKSTAGAARMINARSETLDTKPAFKKLIASRRLLVPATGWYEWQPSPVATTSRGTPRKQPFFIHRGDEAPLAFGGLYTFWRDERVADADDPLGWVASFTIITTPAEPGLDRIHDRAPLVIDPDDWAAWLSPDTPADEVAAIIAARPPGRFDAYPVTPLVNSAGANGPELLTPAPPESLIGVLDPETGEIIGASE